MSKTKVVPLRIPEFLDELAAFRAQQEHTDKATALRQWLHQSAEGYVLGLLSEGRISIGRAAELLDVSVFDVQYLARIHGLELGPTEEQRKRSSELLDRLTGAKGGPA
jgi:hypothetical protein